MHVRIMNGLGDAIYHRPFIKDLCRKGEDVWLDTRWPDVFSDLPIKAGAPQGVFHRPFYNSRSLCFGNILNAIGKAFPPLEQFDFDLPAFPKPQGRDRYAVLRAPVLRNDFYAPARNPDMAYIAQAVRLLQDEGIWVIGVANIQPIREWLDGDAPPVDQAYWHGELSIPDLLGLVAGAALVLGGPGWQVPAALAARVPCLVINGGTGANNAIAKLTDPRIEGARIAAIQPDRFCNCQEQVHDCDKTISDFPMRFKDALEGLRVV
jgi:hypothetical protein